MDIFNHLNWLAIAVAALAYFILGAIWYSFLFRNLWIKSAAVNVNDPEMKKGAGMIMLFTLLLEFVASIGLAILVQKMMLTGSAMAGARLGLLTGLCFAAVAICISYMYQKRPTALHLVDSGYHIVGNIIAAVVLCVWPW